MGFWKKSTAKKRQSESDAADAGILKDDGVAPKTIRQSVHTFTLGYQPLPPVRIKLEYSSNRFDRRRENFNFWGISVGYIF